MEISSESRSEPIKSITRYDYENMMNSREWPRLSLNMAEIICQSHSICKCIRSHSFDRRTLVFGKLQMDLTCTLGCRPHMLLMNMLDRVKLSCINSLCTRNLGLSYIMFQNLAKIPTQWAMQKPIKICFKGNGNLIRNKNRAFNQCHVPPTFSTTKLNLSRWECLRT